MIFAGLREKVAFFRMFLFFGFVWAPFDFFALLRGLCGFAMKNSVLESGTDME
jgi:hypothetical protein